MKEAEKAAQIARLDGEISKLHLQHDTVEAQMAKTEDLLRPYGLTAFHQL
jgi:hypothetical protein